MVRLPKPRPFIQPAKQRPKLANFMILLVFAPYAFMFAVIVAAFVFGVFALTCQYLGLC